MRIQLNQPQNVASLAGTRALHQSYPPTQNTHMHASPPPTTQTMHTEHLRDQLLTPNRYIMNA